MRHGRTRRDRGAWLLATATAVAALLVCGVAAPARADAPPVLYAHDASGDGWYPDQPSLGPQTVGGGQFGELADVALQGRVQAQPLVSDGMLLAVTEGNWVYGLDPKTGATRWSRSVGTPWYPSHHGISCGDLDAHVGITGTPAVDPGGAGGDGVAYFVSQSEDPGYSPSGPEPGSQMEIHALDVQTGSEQQGFPRSLGGIAAANNTQTTFNAKHELQRAALTISGGVVYAAFASHCDKGPYQGWVVGVHAAGAPDAGTIAASWEDLTGANRSGAGIWQSGGGLVSDGPGQLLFSTGNGHPPSAPAPGTSPPGDLGESLVRLTTQADGMLRPTDFFTPYDAATLETYDGDFGSGGPIALPAAFGVDTTAPRLMVAAGKEGYVYLVDRDQLGGFRQGPGGGDGVVGRIGPYGGVWSRPAAFAGDGGQAYVYYPTASGGQTANETAGGLLRIYQAGVDAAGKPTLGLVASSPDTFGFGSSSPVVTSDATNPGSAVLWLVWLPNGSARGAQLRAYAAVPRAGQPRLLASWPLAAPGTKFTPPGVADGRVYVGAVDHLYIFGYPVSAPLTGASVNFGPTIDGTSASATATLTATEDVTVSAVGPPDAPFGAGAPTPPVGTLLHQGDTMTVPVTFAPGPDVAGPQAATLSLATDAGPVTLGLTGTAQPDRADLTSTPPAVSFGGTSPGRQVIGTATFGNDGAKPLTIATVAGPPSNSPFSTIDPPVAGQVIAPGHSLTVTVRFAPTGFGSFTSSIGLTSTDGQSATVGLSGTASGPSRLGIAPAPVAYGRVAVGASPTKTFVVRNSGQSPLTIEKSKPPAGGPFTALTTLSEATTIGPGRAVVERVRFKPPARGSFAAVWPITADDGSGPHELAFVGRGIVPPAILTGLRVSPARVAAGRKIHLRQRLSRASWVRVRLGRLVGGRRVGRGCLRLTRRDRLRPPCTRRLALPGAVQRHGAAGVNHLALTARWAGRRLRSGRYRLSAVAFDADGVSPQRTAAFTVVNARHRRG